MTELRCPPGLSLVAERVTPAWAPLYKLWGPSTLSPRNQAKPGCCEGKVNALETRGLTAPTHRKGTSQLRNHHNSWHLLSIYDVPKTVPITMGSDES